MLRLGYNYAKKIRSHVKILEADFVLTCNTSFDIIKKGAVVFDEKIIETGTREALKEKYPNATHLIAPPNSVILPGLINSHVHLEFSANHSMLSYGDFIPWLHSVIKHRETLNELSKTALIEETLLAMLRSGITTLGAISSFGNDLKACVTTPQRVVYFNEILGSIPSAVDAMYADFLSRYYNSMDEKSSSFIPAVAIHSPYSTHPILAKKAIEIAYKEQSPLSTHFMESMAERHWIDGGAGDFATFFSTFNPHARPLITAMEYLRLFEGIPTLFTHGVHANEEERSFIASMGGSITHCPRSNRLLGVGALELETLKKHTINLTLATDGLSSNTSLSLWDEMRSALMMHTSLPLHELSKSLLQSVTCNAANALRLPIGSLKEGKEADLIVVTLPQVLHNEDELASQLILHTHKTHWNFINGMLTC
jgi:cytosine/adenosine deaminase-related metal-dependent hydrolase